MEKYVCFLRGINVGGNKKVPMEALKEAFLELGFLNITTLLNSGNVIFETNLSNNNLLQTIEKKLLLTFGFEIPIVIVKQQNLEKILDNNPFKDFQESKNLVFYITFSNLKLKKDLKLPYSFEGFEILKIDDYEIYAVQDISGKFNSTSLMNFLDKTFGKKITTRNLNTIQKLSKM